MTSLVVLYVLYSAIAGYISARIYKVLLAYSSHHHITPRSDVWRRALEEQCADDGVLFHGHHICRRHCHQHGVLALRRRCRVYACRAGAVGVGVFRRHPVRYIAGTHRVVVWPVRAAGMRSCILNCALRECMAELCWGVLRLQGGCH